MTIDQTEQRGYHHQWNEWVVKPANVREIDRWRDLVEEMYRD